MKKVTLLFSAFLLSFAVFAQSFEMYPEDMEKMQRIEQELRESTKQEGMSNAKSPSKPSGSAAAVNYSRGLVYGGEINVLFLTPDTGGSEAMRAALDGYDFINASSFPLANLPALTLDDLIPYDVIITFNNNQWLSVGGVSPDLVGDVLAEYLDQGGLFVENSYVMDWDAWQMGGAYVNEGYSAFTQATADLSGTFNMGTVHETGHPILTDVNSFGTDGMSLVQDNGVADGATRIVDWDNGQVLMAVKDNVVSVNFLPMADGFLNYTGDGTVLYKNAVVWLMMNLADPDAPGVPQNLTAVAGDEGALEVTLTWNNPDETFGGETLTELDEVNLYKNNELIHTVDAPVIGGEATFVDDDITAAGTYSYRIQAVNEAGEGPSAAVSVYVGEDVPSAPEDITLVADGNDGLVSWDAPTTGLNGGYLSGDGLTYTVVRMPGNVTVAEDITATEYLDNEIPGIGNYFYTVTASNDIGVGGTAQSNIALLGAEGILMYETFDYATGAIPPGWTTDGMGAENWSVFNSNAAGGTAPELRLNWSPSFDGLSRIITYPIDVEGQTELRFKFRQFLSNFSTNEGEIAAIDVTFDGGNTWEAIWEIVIEANVPAGQYELYFDVPNDATDMHFGFRFEGNSFNINQWYFDNLTLEPVEENDLVGVAIAGNTTPSATFESTYTIHVQNAGTETQTDYTVKLMKEGGIELASVAGEPIEFGETLSFELVWTPEVGEEGPTFLYGYVELANDEVPGNNQTPNLNIVVQPEDVIVITLGDGEKLVTQPINFFWDYSISQTLYFPEELEMGGGVITGLQWYNSFVADYLEKDVMIWLGETDAEDLTGGWVDPSTLVLVFDGQVDFPAGQNSIYINFDDIYVYSGGNLVVYTYKADNEWTSGQNFFNTEDAGSSRSRRAERDGTPIDPANPDLPGFTNHDYPNVSFFFSTAGLGALEGNVTDEEANAMEEVLVRVLGTNSSTLTDEDGNFEFPFLLPELYDVEFSKFGYHTHVEEGVEVPEEDVVTVNVVLSPIAQYMVSGTVVGNDGLDIGGASIYLDGYDNYVTETAADGTFLFPEVYMGEYTFTIVAEGYDLYSDQFDVEDHVDLGVIEIIETIVPPGGLAVDVDNQEDGNALLTWSDNPAVEFRYDNGFADAQIGSPGGTLNTVIGSAHRNNAELFEISWYLTSEGGPHNSVTVWVVGLDSNGNPEPGNILYTQAGVVNVDNQWNTYEFSAPVSAPNGFLIGLSYAGFVGLATDDGADPEWPFSNNTHFFTTNVNTDAFQPIENFGFAENLLIRAFGIDNGPTGAKGTVADNAAANGDLTLIGMSNPVYTGKPIYKTAEMLTAPKAFTGFNVFLDDELEAEAITEMEYLFTDLEEGTYTAGVQSVYTTGVSDIITVDFEIVFSVPVTFTVETNSGDSPEGAVVTFTNQDNEHFTFTHTVGEDGVAHFESVRKGMYTLHIEHENFHTYVVENINLQDELEYTAVLEEIITAPFGLLVETEGLPEGDAHFSWNNILAGDLDEGFEGDVFPPAGWTTLNPDGGTGWERLAVGTTPLPGWTGGEAVPAPDGGQFMAFTSWEQGGATSNDQYLITPQIVVANGHELSFYMRYWPDAYNDNVDIRLSTTTNDDPAAFNILVEALTFGAGSSTDWVLYTYDLSDYVAAGTPVYVAFREHVADNFNEGAAIMLDNVYYGAPMQRAIPEPIAMKGVHAIVDRDFSYVSAPKSAKAHVGYNVFLNDVMVAEEITAEEYMFTDLPAGTHVAGVQSVYTSGTSEIVTIEFEIEFTLPDPFPVTFTVIDETEMYEALRIKGEMTDPEWMDVPLTEGPDHVWTVTLDVLPGTYQWGITEDDGSEYGIWLLPDGVNLEFTLDEEGNITGVTSYTLEGDNVEELFYSNINMYPNPTRDMVTLKSGAAMQEIRIMDLSGRVVYENNVLAEEHQVNVRGFEAGIYFVQIITVEGIFTGKLQIQK